MLSGRDSNVRNALSEGTATVTNAVSRRFTNTKKWLKSKARSKPFQWVISAGQGLSLGSSLHDALTKILSLTPLAGLAARIVGNLNFGIAGLTTFVMSYLTYTYVHTNITSESSTAERLQEHDTQHELHDKRFINHQQSSVKLIEIMLRERSDADDQLSLDQYQISAELMQALLQGDTASPASKAKIEKLLEKTLLNYNTLTQHQNAAKQQKAETLRLLQAHLDQTINNYNAFNQQQFAVNAEAKQSRANAPQLSPVYEQSVNEKYQTLDESKVEIEMGELSIAPSHNALSRRGLASPSDRFFTSSSPHLPAFPNSVALTGSHPLAQRAVHDSALEDGQVSISISDEKEAYQSPRISPRSMGGSIV
jgi:hypothetical protein